YNILRELHSFFAPSSYIRVLNIDEHLWVNAVQDTKEFRPVRLIVALAQCHEVPGGVLRPLIGPFITAEVGALFGRIKATEAVIQHAVELDRLLVNTRVFRCGTGCPL